MSLLRPPPVAPATEAPARVLIADDGADNRVLLARLLQPDGYRIALAADGRQALAAALQEPPDLLLLDVIMPELDGFEVIRLLKERPETAEVPVIFLSALEDSADRLRGLQLGAVDWVAKPFDPAEVRARVRNQVRLRQLARSLSRAHAELQARQARLDEDLRAAASIQRALLPRSAPACPAFEAAWRFVPCESVGGDMLDLRPQGDGRYALWLVDVAGHGVPAAMLTVSLAQSLSSSGGLLAAADAGPARVLQRLDAEYPFERFERHATLACLQLDVRDGTLRGSLAGHPEPLVLRADGAVERLGAGGPLLGLGGPFEEQRLALRPGDRVFLHSDGLVELEGPRAAIFGEERLQAFLAGRRDEPLQATCDALLAEVRAFAGGRPLRDDLTFLALHFHGPLAGPESVP